MSVTGDIFRLQSHPPHDTTTQAALTEFYIHSAAWYDPAGVDAGCGIGIGGAGRSPPSAPSAARHRQAAPTLVCARAWLEPAGALTPAVRPRCHSGVQQGGGPDLPLWKAEICRPWTELQGPG
eukprot:scaffold137_cov398-Prasinococcus_capsulatus_cf.AAC.37